MYHVCFRYFQHCLRAASLGDQGRISDDLVDSEHSTRFYIFWPNNHLRSTTENKRTRGPTKVECAQLLSPHDMLTFINGGLATGNFRHPDGYETNKTQGGVVCIYENKHSSVGVGKESE